MYQNQQQPDLKLAYERYLLAEKARNKLIRCAHSGKGGDLNLRILVGHANLLDRLALEEHRDELGNDAQSDTGVYNSVVSEDFLSDSESDSGESDVDSYSYSYSDSDSDEYSQPDEYCYDASETPAVTLYEVGKHVYRRHHTQQDRHLGVQGVTTTTVTLVNDKGDESEENEEGDADDETELYRDSCRNLSTYEKCVPAIPMIC
ncbi:LAME_0A01728g1_1 [Lachancea meyersii CBS 8951]|uniref:LAME_0A01728g1_1 n=1 Tax=Lachancea meyersii CBS 8951 TaxID=1266667 RepID=A0A1G4IMK5_9SACH|nr:LAME_0A01728g1_1 [Lachancea meyersii CBS 8951]